LLGIMPPGAPSRGAEESTVVRSTGSESATPRESITAIAVLAAGYVVLWAVLAGLPFQDVPNHVARAIVIGDLLFDGGIRFGEHFTFAWQAVPYVLGDVLMLPLARLLPADVAGRALVVLEWVSLPLAVAFLLHAWRAPASTRAIAVLFSLYLATDLFFVLGFANFRLAVALVLAAFAAWNLALRTGAPAWWLAYLSLAIAGYLMHLAAIVFLAAAVGIVSLLRLVERRESFARLLLAGLPVLGLLAWHVLAQEPAAPAPSLQPSTTAKALRLAAPLIRFRDGLEIAVFLLFAGAVLAAALAIARRASEAVERELAALATAFVGLYFVLPEAQGAIWAIDTRALSFGWLWGALLAAYAAPRLGWTRGLFAVGSVVALVNVLYLGQRLAPIDAFMRDYRAELAALPRGVTALPITTGPKRGFTNPTAHAALFATIDRDAIVPYTFSGDVGMPMRYFRFRDRPAAPWQFWYQFGMPPEGGAQTIGAYSYLLVEQPVDWRRLPVSGRVVSANAAVAIVVPRAAPPHDDRTRLRAVGIADDR
jgi:hypothetical protein